MAFEDVFDVTVPSSHSTTRARIRKNWAWYVALGLGLVALGAVAISASTLTTAVMLRFFGWALLLAGVLELGGAFGHDRWRGFSMVLVAGIFYIVVGTAVVANPMRSATALTLVVAVFLVVQGALRVIVSLAHRDPGWPWILLHGVVSLALGIAVWARWPLSGTWMLGLFVGIEVMLTGVTIAMLGLTSHREAHAPTPREHGHVPA